MTSQALDEFALFVDSTLGLYLDMRRGFGAIVHEFDQVRADYLRKQPEKTAAELDNLTMTYGVGDQDEPGSYALHECEQAEYRHRNSPTGENPIRAGNMCLIHMFQFWDDYYRAKIAISLGMEKNDLKVDIFGDMRLLRHSIIHHRAIALAEVERCKLIKWFKEGDNISMTRPLFLQLVALVHDGLNELRKKIKT